MLKHIQDAKLGTFDYDDTEFCLKEDITAIATNLKHLKYIGKETDGSKIHIPQGITSCFGMFANNTTLVSAPQIPEGVIDCSRMFNRCTHLINAKITLPDSLVNASHMFARCFVLQETPVNIPRNVTTTSFMFADCFKLKQNNFKEFPKNVCISSHMFTGCSLLEKTPTLHFGMLVPNERTKYSYSYMFHRCRNLKVVLCDFKKIANTKGLDKGAFISCFSDCDAIINLRYKSNKEIQTVIELFDIMGIGSICDNTYYLGWFTKKPNNFCLEKFFSSVVLTKHK